MHDPQETRPRPPQGWSWAAVILGTLACFFAALAHVVSLLYVSLASGHASDADTRLTLGTAVAYGVLLLGVAVFAVVSAGIGLREAARTRSGRGVAVAGMLVAIVGLLAWLMGGTHLLIAAIARLR
jgi:hypothetical protein